VEHVGDAVALEHVGEALRPGHFAVVADLHGLSYLAVDCRFKMLLC